MPTNSPLTIIKIEIEELFGDLNHSIPLSQEGITFIHGPNGSGKTTLLKLVAAAINRDMAVLRSVWYSKLRLYLSDSHCLEVVRSSSSEPQPNTSQSPSDLVQAELTLVLKKTNPVTERDQELSRKSINVDLFREFRRTHEPQMSPPNILRLARLIEQFLPLLERVGPREWRNRTNGQRHGITEVLDIYGDSLPFTLPDWFAKICDRIRIGSIQAQRLLNISLGQSRYGADLQQQVQDAVEVYSKAIAETIGRTLAQNAWSSQIKERSFARRLILKQAPTVASEASLREQYHTIEEKLQELIKTGLYTDTESFPLPDQKLTPTERRVVALYLADMNDKLALFDDLQSKILGLQQIIGNKLRRKRLQINREKGFVFTTTGKRQTVLKPSDLSSGEQHQVVMFYQLIFASPSGCLFLVDEPEISLHVEWQRQFLSDLQRVASLRNHTFLVATHSPQIINNRLDLAVPLDGGIES